MRRILSWLDQNLLKILVGFLIAFIPLWPKLPIVGIPHTWVYIRLEDFFIALTFFWWFTRLLRRKLSINTPLTLPIFLYWTAGFISLIFTLLFTAKHLANFFPNVAVFHFLRRIEYLGMFIIAFSTITSKRDLKFYLWIIVITILGVVFYGFGQKFLGFPAYLTMNEEFAKGVPLRLASTSRLSSTFAGHYDLAAYLVLMIAFLVSLVFGVKNFLAKIGLLIIAVLALIMLLLTASRISFIVYLIALSIALWLSKKKALIIPAVIISIFLMTMVSGASERFSKTFRVRSVVYNIDTGQPVGTLEDNGGKQTLVPISEDVKENLPVGSGFIGLGQSGSSEATTTAMIRKPVPQTLKYSTYSAEIATISGSFLIQKALVYDISFTTRFQGEWPRAITAFYKNPLLGTGFSSIGLATDGDYVRMLGEVGILGTVTFLLIFAAGGIFLKNAVPREKDPFLKSAGIGLTAGVVGIMVNALLIDVFEASKVAFTLWILAGIVFGSLFLNLKVKVPYLQELKKMLQTNIFILIFLILLSVAFLFGGLGIYFAGDDFTWLRWGAESTFNDIPKFFLSADGFFYRPLAKIIYQVLYNIFWLQPQGYHLLALAIHIGNAFFVYLIGRKFWGNKIWPFIAASLFLILAIHGESLFWMPASLEMIAPFFALLSFLLYLNGKKYLAVFAFFPALFGHEGIITFHLIVVAYDYIFKKKKNPVIYLLYVIITAIYLWLRFRAGSHWFNGDYSYNFANLPFNFIGNFLAYLSSSLGGIVVLEKFTLLRAVLREQKIIALIFGLAGVLFLGILFKKISKKPAGTFIIFFLAAFTVAIFPYLGLGNTASRYGYFASAWIILLMLYLLMGWVKSRHNKQMAVSIVALIIIVFSGWNLRDLAKTQNDWKKAGEITYTTYLLLRQNFLDIPKRSTFYVTNIPISYGRAWVFPVGFDDGVWQLFRDKKTKVVKVNSIEEGLEAQKKTKNSHVFTFDNYEIKEVR